MKISILAKSSSNPEKPYSVDFIKEDERIKIFCSCPAGIHRQLCKHKIELIQGNKKRLHDSNDLEALNQASTLFSDTEFLNHIANYYQKIKEIEKLKKGLKEIKLDLAKKMIQGIEL